MCPNNLYANQSEDRALWNPTGLTPLGRSAVSQAAQPMRRVKRWGVGRDVLGTNTTSRSLVREHIFPPRTTARAEQAGPGSFTARHEIQGAALEFRGRSRNTGAGHHSNTETHIETCCYARWLHGDIESNSTQIKYYYFVSQW